MKLLQFTKSVRNFSVIFEFWEISGIFHFLYLIIFIRNDKKSKRQPSGRLDCLPDCLSYSLGIQMGQVT